MATSPATISGGYLSGAVAETVEGFGGVLQHLQNLLSFGDQPSAKKFLDMGMAPAAGTMSIYADIHNAPSRQNVLSYCNNLGNKSGMKVTPGSNEKGHGGTAGFHSDAKVGLLGAKAGGLYMLGFPQTSGMINYMQKPGKALILGAGAHQVSYDGDVAVNVIVYCRRTNCNLLSEEAGEYETFIPEEESLAVDPAHYEHTLKWLDGFLKSIGSSLTGAFAAAFDKLKDTNGLCVHYLVLQDHGFNTQAFDDGVKDDIVINVAAKEGQPAASLLRLSHEIAKQFDCTSLKGREFRINGQVVDLKPLCPTAQPKLFGPISVTVPGGGLVHVTLFSKEKEHVKHIADGAIVLKFGDLLLPEHVESDRLVAVRKALNAGDARFKGRENRETVMVDQSRGALTPAFLEMVTAAAAATAEGTPGKLVMPWPRLREFVKETCELDKVQGSGLEALRLVFGLKSTFLVADVGSSFPTNNTKTGLFDPATAAKAILAKALVPMWIARADALPADHQAKVDAFRAAKAEKAKSALAKKAAKDADKLNAAAGGGGELQLGRVKRKAAVEASKCLAQSALAQSAPAVQPAPERAKRAKPLAVPSNPALSASALLAENARLKARIALLEGQPATAHAAAAAADRRAATTSREAALEARVAALEAQLTAFGIVPTTTALALSQA